MVAMRNFSARETEWLLELDGIELAPFWRRASAFVLDFVFMFVSLLAVLGVGALLYLQIRVWQGHPMPVHTHVSLTPEDFGITSADSTANLDEKGKSVKEALDLLVPIFYFGLLTWKGKGRTPGKWLLKIRVVSLVHRHLTLWHAIERALGYGAAALEFGFGFIQFFIHPYHRCVQDRIAETIVVTESGYEQMQFKSEHKLLPDDDNVAETHIADEALPPTPETQL